MEYLILPSENKCLICKCDYGTAGAEFEKFVFKCEGCMRKWRSCWECKFIEKEYLPFVVKHQGMLRCINCVINKCRLYNVDSIKDLYKDIRIDF